MSTTKRNEEIILSKFENLIKPLDGLKDITEEKYEEAEKQLQEAESSGNRKKQSSDGKSSEKLKKLEEEKQTLQTKIEELEKEQLVYDDKIYDLELQVDSITDKYEDKMYPLEREQGALELDKTGMELEWNKATLPLKEPEDDLNKYLGKLDATDEQKNAISSALGKAESMAGGGSYSGGSSRSGSSSSRR